MFKLRLEQGRIEEAEKIYKAMQRLVPSIEDDKEKSTAKFMHYAEGRLIKASEKFRKRYFAMGDKKREAPTAKNVLSDFSAEAASPAAIVLSGSAAEARAEGHARATENIRI